MLDKARQFDQQPEHADQNGNTGAQQHERENKNQGRLEAAGCRHGDRLDDGRAGQDAPDAVRRSAFSAKSLIAFA